MTFSLYTSADVLLFSAVILLIIIFHSLLHYDNLQLSARYRMLVSITILAIIILDFLSRLTLPFNTSVNYVILYCINFIYFILQPLPVSIGLMYLFSLFREKRFPVLYHLLFLIPFFSGCIVMMHSLFTDVIFFLDADNVYHRGPGMAIYAVINYSYIIPAVYLIIHNRDKVKRGTILVVIIYTIIPLAGSLFQLLFYGIITAWPSFTLALLLVFIFIEGRKSDRDYLTGLLNRQCFDARIYSRIEQFDKKGSFTLVVIDLNKFKSINDEFGHDQGDEALQAVSLILSHSVSPSDAAARYGGDEFILLLETADEGTVHKILQRIQKNLDEWNRKGDMPFTLSLSAGYAVYDPVKLKDYNSLFKCADEMMFSVKTGSR